MTDKQKSYIDVQEGSYIYIVDRYSYEILAFSENVKSIRSNMVCGVRCHEIIEDRKVPCSNCPIYGLEQRRTNTVVMYNDPFGDMVDVCAAEIMWEELRPAVRIEISEHKLTAEEQDRRRIEQRYSIALRSFCDYILETDLDTRTYICYKPSGRSYYYIPEEGDYNGQVLDFAMHYVTPGCREAYLENFELDNLVNRLQKAGKEVVTEFVIVDDRKKTTYIQRTDTLVSSGEGQRFILSYTKNVTDTVEERKRIQEEIIDYADAVGIVYDEIYSVDLIKGISVTLKKGMDFGAELYKPEKNNISSEYAGFIHKADRELFLNKFSSDNMKLFFLKGGKHLQAEVRRSVPYGDYEWIEVNAVSLVQLDLTRILIMIRVIDVQKRLEEESKIAQIKLSTLLRNSYSEVYEVNLTTNEVYSICCEGNRLDRFLVEQDYQQMFDIMVRHIIYPDDRQEYYRLFSLEQLFEAYQKGITEQYGEIRKKNDKGDYQWYSYLIQIMPDACGDILLYSFAKNIDDIKSLEGEKTQLEKIVNQVIREEYIGINVIDLRTCRYGMYAAKGVYSSIPADGDYNAETWSIGRNLVIKEDQDKFYKTMGLDYVIDALHDEDAYVETTYRIKQGQDELQYHRARFTYFNKERDTIILTLKDETSQILTKMEETKRTKLEEDRFNFLVNSVCETFMEVNVKTGECVITYPAKNIEIKKSYIEQIECLLQGLPKEEKDSYIRKFELSNIINEVEKNNGVYITDCDIMEDSERRHLLVTNTYLKGPYDMEYVFTYSQDITMVQEQERKSKEAIMEALEVARKANKAKGEFLSRMSHEIRTPLNAIMGMTDLVRLTCRNSPEVTDYLDKISGSSRYLLSLINDILDMSKIESGKMEIASEPFSIRGLLNEVEVLFAPKASVKQIQMEINNRSGLDWVYGDRLRVNQVIANLVSNALKFTDNGGTVWINLDELYQGEENVIIRFSVKDNGIGIKNENLERIFEKFEQEEYGTILNYGGTGLGLSISRNIIRLMGGELFAASTYGKGSEFYFSISFQIVEEEKIEAADIGEEDGIESYDFTGIHILLAEDNELNIEVARELLRISGASVDVAVNGRKAVSMFEQSEEGFYDVILMDVMMPWMNGLQATAAIRALNKRKDAASAVIIGMSANAFEGDVRKGIEAGMDAYTSKPIDIKRVYRLIKRLLTERAKETGDI